MSFQIVPNSNLVLLWTLRLFSVCMEWRGHSFSFFVFDPIAVRAWHYSCLPGQ